MKPGYPCWFSDCVVGWKKWGSISDKGKIVLSFKRSRMTLEPTQLPIQRVL